MISRSKFVLPNAKHGEGPRAQLAGHEPRALPVELDLLLPVPPVVLWHRSIASRAAVPEAPVHEDRYTKSWEDEVGRARQPRVVHRPFADSVTHKRGAELPFGGSISSRPHRAHPPTAFGPTENVHLDGLARPIAI